MLKKTAAMLAFILSAMPVFAADLKQEVKESARETGEAFKKAGEKIADGAKKVGKETKEIAVEVKDGFKKAGKETGKAMKEMGREIGETISK